MSEFNSSQFSEGPVNKKEAKDHIEILKRILNSPTSKEIEKILIEALMLFGFRFAYSLRYCANIAIDDQKIFYKNLSEDYILLFTKWLGGNRMTDRIDESERRAYYGNKIISEDNPIGLFRLAAKAILSLPENHELRNIDIAHQAILKFLNYAKVNQNNNWQLLAIQDLLKYRLESKDNSLKLIQVGKELLKDKIIYNQDNRKDFLSQSDVRNNFQFAVIGYYLELAIDERDTGNMDGQRSWTEAAQETFNQIKTNNLEPGIDKPGNVGVKALLYEVMEKYVEAADTYAKIVDSGKEMREEIFCKASENEGRLRIELREYERAIKVLTPLVPIFESRYLNAVEDNNILATGEKLANILKWLAFAHLNLDHWNESIKSLEKSKSLRLRYQATLRKSALSQKLLKMELASYALSRGVNVDSSIFNVEESSDWLGKRVSLHSRILEEYRRQRPNLSLELLEVPSISQISSLIANDEAIVILGVGLFMAVILQNDKDYPTGRFLLNEWPLKRLFHIFAGEQEDGWLFALGAPEKRLDRKKALERLIDGIDYEIGKKLGSFLEDKNIRKVTIIPHSLLHLVPFWSLPSLMKFEVTTFPSLAHFITSQQLVKIENRKALVITDPLLDLPLSPIEADSVTNNLSKIGIDVDSIVGENATDEVITQKILSASIFHFCGHGESDLIKPIRSHLMLFPNKRRFPDSDPFTNLIASAEKWKKTDPDENERCADLKDHLGRICEQEISFPDAKRIERRFEYSETGTLWGLYIEDKLIKLAELWTVGDIMVAEYLKDCKLVFLSACESGISTQYSIVDEYSGLPAALQLAGASTVISTMWPVSDVLTILYVDLFYHELITSTQQINIATIIRNVNHRLRDMRNDEVAGLLNDLRKKTSNKYIRTLLKAHAYNFLNAENECPFSHPYEWAAFYVVGAKNLSFNR